MTNKSEFSKGLPTSVLYIGLLFLGIGQTFFWGKFKNNNLSPIGMIMSFVGFIMVMFYIPNRNDQICTFDKNDEMTCVTVKK